MSTLAEIFFAERAVTQRLWSWVRRLGPYLAIELLLPGGTLIALLLWVYRQRSGAASSHSFDKSITTLISSGWRSMALRHCASGTRREISLRNQSDGACVSAAAASS